MGTTFKGLDNKGKYRIMPNTFSVDGMTFLCGNSGFILKQSDDGLAALRGDIVRVNGCGVGRCTGLKDKNDKDIYENDFLYVGSSVYLVQDSDSGFVAKGITTDDATLTAELAATTMALNTLGDTPVWTDAEAGTTTLWGHTVSGLQSNVNFSYGGIDGEIIGTLSYVGNGTLARDWGAGYFLVLKFTDLIDADKIMVGLVPSVSSGLVALDEDMNAVFKITDKNKQVLVVDAYKDADVIRKKFSLTGLILTHHA